MEVGGYTSPSGKGNAVRLAVAGVLALEFAILGPINA